MKQEPSALAAALGSISTRRPGPRCQMGMIMERVRTEDRGGFDLLDGLMDDPQVPASAIAEALYGAGYVINSHTVNRHRKRGTARGCACPK